MESVSFELAAQSTFYKLKPSASKDYGIFIDSKSYEFLKPAITGADAKGKEQIDLIIYKDDCIRAIGNIMGSLPLYTSKSGVCREERNAVDVYNDLSNRVSSFFEKADKKSLTGLYFTDLQGRKYLWGTEGRNSIFELRKFFIANHTTLTFQYEVERPVLRFDTQIVNQQKDPYQPYEGSKDLKTQSINIENTQAMEMLSAVRTKPFLLLAGISGTGKSRIVRKLAQATVPKDLQVAFDGKKRSIEDFKTERWSLQRPANFELIQVKPNWHNSMDVIGYLSNIPSPHYVFTPFINFIVRAMCHEDVPFFLCLDEMNLAPVEEYFAEFLSAIESRAMTEEGYMTDPIIAPFKSFGEVNDYQNGGTANVGKDMLSAIEEIIKEEGISDERRGKVLAHLREKGVTLPKNLIIVGTVNMDETTFSFSRKVLDRAMSMEMNTVDYSSFLTGHTDDDIKAIAEAYEVDSDPTGDHNQLNRLLVDRHIEAKEVVGNLGGAAEGSDARFVIDYLETINKLLDGTPFKLGYRAANEALIYVKSAKDFGNDNQADAMDKFTLMKILSRIEGDESKLKLTQDDSKRLTACGVELGKLSDYPCGPTILSALREIIVKRLGDAPQPPKGGDVDDAEIEVPRPTEGGELEDVPEKSPRESIKKLDSMMAQLDKDHFVSYWS